LLDDLRILAAFRLHEGGELIDHEWNNVSAVVAQLGSAAKCQPRSQPAAREFSEIA
jgi:hypothetical protein